MHHIPSPLRDLSYSIAAYMNIINHLMREIFDLFKINIFLIWIPYLGIHSSGFQKRDS